MSIKTRLILIFLSMAIIPAFFLGTLIFHNGVVEIQRLALADLRLIAEGKEAEIREFIDAKKGRAVDFTTDAFIRFSTGRINSLTDREDRLRTGQILSDYLIANKKPVDDDLIEIHILDKNGVVIASTDPEFIGSNDSAKMYFREGLKESFVQGVDTHTHGGERHNYIPVSAPIKVGDEPIGVLMNGYGVDLAYNILSGERSKALGSPSSVSLAALEGIDMFLVNREGYIFTPSKKMLGYGQKDARVSTLPVTSCLKERKDVNAEWTDAGGRAVWGASSCIQIKNGPVWTLVIEQEEALALAPIREMRYVFYLIGLGLVAVVGLTAWAVALSISRPIEKLRKGTEIIATGDLDYKVHSDSHDEIGELSSAFDKMTEKLKAITASRDELMAEVSERKKAEEALRASENKYRNFVDNALVGIFSSNINGEILYTNRALLEMFEYDSAEEMAQIGLLNIYKNPEERRVFMKMLREKGNVDDFEADFVTKKGSVKHMLLSGTLSADGVITGMAVDLTEIKKARAISREAERVKAQVEFSEALGNAALDFNGVVDTITRYTAALLGEWSVLRLLSEDGLRLNPAAAFHSDPEKSRMLKDLVATNPVRADSGPGAEVVKKGKALLLDTPEKLYTIVSPEQRDVLLRDIGAESLLLVPLRAYGKVIGTLAVARDRPQAPFTRDDILLMQDLADRASLAVSNARLFGEIEQELMLRKTAEEVTKNYAAALERSNADLQQFAYAASHDLQEPLRMVASYLKLLMRHYGDKLDDEALKFINRSIEGSIRMEKMITDLLQYSRVQTQAPEFTGVDCEAVLKQACDNLRVAIKENNARITHDSLPVVRGDATQLMQVFQNLLSNAIKFRSPAPPRIHVSTRDAVDKWVFSVEDNGIGIRREDRERIFVIFQRIDEKNYPGTGIGLALVKKIIERHGGMVWVTSEEGKGTIFHFTIPKNAAR